MTFKRAVLVLAASAVVALVLSGCSGACASNFEDCECYDDNHKRCWDHVTSVAKTHSFTLSKMCQSEETYVTCMISSCGRNSFLMNTMRYELSAPCGRGNCPKLCNMIDYGSSGHKPAVEVGNDFHGTFVNHGSNTQSLFEIGDNFHGTVVNHGSNVQTSDYKMEVQSVDHSKNVHFAQQQMKDCEGSGNGDSDGAAQVVCCKSEGAVCCASAAFNGVEVGTESSQCPANHPYIQRWVEVPNNKPAPSQLLVYVSFGAVALLVLGCVACAWQRIKARRATSNIDDETLVE